MPLLSKLPSTDGLHTYLGSEFLIAPQPLVFNGSNLACAYRSIISAATCRMIACADAIVDLPHISDSCQRLLRANSLAMFNAKSGGALPRVYYCTLSRTISHAGVTRNSHHHSLLHFSPKPFHIGAKSSIHRIMRDEWPLLPWHWKFLYSSQISVENAHTTFR